MCKSYHHLACGVVFGAALLTPGFSQAFEGIAQIGYGAKSQSMAGTGVADDTGVGGLLNNPATLALGNGNAMEIGADLIVPTSQVRSTGGLGKVDGQTHGFNRTPYLAPNGGYTRRLDNGMTVGIAAFSKGGAGAEWGDRGYQSIDSTGVQTNKDIGSRLLGLDIPIGFSYPVNDRLNVGASFDVVWTGTNMLWQINADQLASFAGSGALRVSDNAGLATAVNGIVGAGGGLYFAAHKRHFIDGAITGVGWGGRVGMTYQLTPSTRFGASYSLKTHLPDLDGRATAEALAPGGATAVTLKGDVQMEDFQWPSQLQLGVTHQINDAWKISVDTRYARWADVMKEIKLRYQVKSDSAGNAFVGETIALDIPQNWDNTLALAVGAEYKLNERWTLRGGVSRIDNPIPAANLLAILPPVFEQHTTVGFGYKINKQQTLNMSMSYISMDDVTNTARPYTSTHGLASGGTKFGMSVYKFGLSYRYEF